MKKKALIFGCLLLLSLARIQSQGSTYPVVGELEIVKGETFYVPGDLRGTLLADNGGRIVEIDMATGQSSEYGGIGWLFHGDYISDTTIGAMTTRGVFHLDLQQRQIFQVLPPNGETGRSDTSAYDWHQDGDRFLAHDHGRESRLYDAIQHTNIPLDNFQYDVADLMWSNDYETIAVLLEDGRNGPIYVGVIPGNCVYESACELTELAHFPNGLASNIMWSPDDMQLLIPITFLRDETLQLSRIVSLNVGSGARDVLTNPNSGYRDTWPVLSPDNRYIAFLRSGHGGGEHEGMHILNLETNTLTYTGVHAIPRDWRDKTTTLTTSTID